MRRKVFTFAAALSLLLCAGTVVLRITHAEVTLLTFHTRGMPYGVSLDGRQLSVSNSDWWRSVEKSHSDRGEAFMYVQGVWLGKGCIVIYSDISFVRSDDSGDQSTFNDRKERWSWDRREASSRVPINPPLSAWKVLGFWREEGDAHGEQWVIPLWPVIVLSAIPTFVFVRHWSRFRPRRGFCSTCFYDLRGNTSGVCPQCGTVVAGKSPAAVAEGKILDMGGERPTLDYGTSKPLPFWRKPLSWRQVIVLAFPTFLVACLIVIVGTLIFVWAIDRLGRSINGI